MPTPTDRPRFTYQTPDKRNSEQLLSRREYIAEQLTDAAYENGNVPTFLDALLAKAGIEQVAENHPDWDMDNDRRTREVWRSSEDLI